ncbi:MAG: hypothetical protein M1812_005932 [Candelaria pacifica]|nr:MAG: hypothetical protein M1812_005932 [Candelaria pacifica]
MDIANLLQECERLDHNGRMKRMVKLGQSSTDNAYDRTLIQELLQGSLYEQILGLQTCHGSRDVKPALQALASPSRILKSRALPFIHLLGTDKEALEALKLVPPYLQASFVHRLRKRRRLTVIDTFLAQLGSSKIGEELFRRLLPYASEELVKERLLKAPEQIKYDEWTKLIRYHPKVACLAIRDWAERVKSYNAALERAVSELLRRQLLPDSLWDTVLEVARLMLKSNPSKRLSIGTLYRKRSQVFDKLVFDMYEREPFSLDWRGANKLPTELLLRLFERYPTILTQKDFDELHPEKRLAIYRVIPQGWRGEDGVLPQHIIFALPREERVHEARKHLGLQSYETNPSRRIPFVACLPWEEALPLQNVFIRSNDADIRSVALKCQIGAAKYQHGRYGDALQLVLQRKFDQDPVRLQMLGGLGRLPPTHWKEEHLPGLAIVIRDALDASDLSKASEGALNSLVIPLLSVYPSWAASQFAIILREREQFHIRLQLSGKVSTKEVIICLAKALLPVLRLWLEQGKWPQLLCLGRALEPYIRDFPEFLDILEQRLKATHNRLEADYTLKLFRKYSPHRLHLLTPLLLELDPSYVVVEAIWQQVHRRQQDLITPYLDSKASEGRFIDDKRTHLHWISNCYYRWTLKQQERLGETLSAMIRDRERPTVDPKQRIGQLQNLCFLDATYLTPFTKDERPAVGDFALRALSRLDAGQGLPTLLENLHTEKARIAVYALRRVFRTMPRSKIFELLKTAPLDKVTVAKEVIRLIGELKTEEAYQYLLEKDESDLHSDTRIALLQVLWLYPERAETWERLKKAAQDPKPPIPKALAHTPADGLSVEQDEWLAVMLETLLSHPSAEVRMETLKRCKSTPPSDPSQHLSHRLLSLVESPIEDESLAAFIAIHKIYKETHVSLIVRAFETILLVGERRGMIIHRVSPYLIRELSVHRQHTLPIALAILRLLENHSLPLRMRLNYVFTTFPWPDFRIQFDKLTPLLHADTLVHCEQEIEKQLTRRADAKLDELENEFSSSGDERLRRLGLAALDALSKKSQGWTDEMRDKLDRYRADESMLVREAAMDVFPPVLRWFETDEGGVERVVRVRW